jgi:hypothetical protein
VWLDPSTSCFLAGLVHSSKKLCGFNAIVAEYITSSQAKRPRVVKYVHKKYSWLRTCWLVRQLWPFDRKRSESECSNALHRLGTKDLSMVFKGCHSRRRGQILLHETPLRVLHVVASQTMDQCGNASHNAYLCFPHYDYCRVSRKAGLKR